MVKVVFEMRVSQSTILGPILYGVYGYLPKYEPLTWAIIH